MRFTSWNMVGFYSEAIPEDFTGIAKYGLGVCMPKLHQARTFQLVHGHELSALMHQRPQGERER